MPATIVITEYLVSFFCIVCALVAVTIKEHVVVIFTNANLYCFFIFALRSFELENCTFPAISNIFAFSLN